jgi:regulator of sigma E protease
MIAQFVLSLSLLVVLHEFGHFIPAKLFKTRVEKFYLFFNPWFELFKTKIGETEWGIGWLPLGGYVKIAGMMDESFDKEQLKTPPQPWEFRSKPAWQRLIIMVGGVTVNFLLGAFIIGMMLNVWGEDFMSSKSAIYGMETGAAAKEAGLQDGDKIIALDGTPVNDLSKLTRDIIINKVQKITIDRNGQTLDIPLDVEKRAKIAGSRKKFVAPLVPLAIDSVLVGSPLYKAGFRTTDKMLTLNGQSVQFLNHYRKIAEENKNKEVKLAYLRANDTLTATFTVPDNAITGIAPTPPDKLLKYEHRAYSLPQAIPLGFTRSVSLIGDQLSAFSMMFRGEVKAKDSLGGFGSIASLFPTTWDWQQFWRITAMLSLILAFMNLLPIPILDGGHVVFLLYEWITGKAPSEKFLEYAQTAGFIFILGLVLLSNGFDILRWLGLMQ